MVRLPSSTAPAVERQTPNAKACIVNLYCKKALQHGAEFITDSLSSIDQNTPGTGGAAPLYLEESPQFAAF
jgi:hypothetical protein